ncbi:MAG: flagellar biosynthesis protein [Firmicutes bacterium]|nr:flagellar biosynthesis protein [Bacillota bacterium]
MIEDINNLKLRQIQPGEVLSRPREVPKQENGGSFKELLQTKIEEKSALQFSKHSRERIAQRGIEVTNELMSQLNSAAETARTKGAKDVVMIGSQAAFIVNIPNNIVVTAMNGNEMKNNIFTNIDSAVML